jgi:hypothetical protein
MQQTSVLEIAAAERRYWLSLYVLCVGMPSVCDASSWGGHRVDGSES